MKEKMEGALMATEVEGYTKKDGTPVKGHTRKGSKKAKVADHADVAAGTVASADPMGGADVTVVQKGSRGGVYDQTFAKLSDGTYAVRTSDSFAYDADTLTELIEHLEGMREQFVGEEPTFEMTYDHSDDARPSIVGWSRITNSAHEEEARQSLEAASRRERERERANARERAEAKERRLVEAERLLKQEKPELFGS